jgi:hypothetical protein
MASKSFGAVNPVPALVFNVAVLASDRSLARRCLEKLFSWDFDKLIVAHGICVEKDARSFVERAFRWLVD